MAYTGWFAETGRSITSFAISDANKCSWLWYVAKEKKKRLLSSWNTVDGNFVFLFVIFQIKKILFQTRRNKLQNRILSNFLSRFSRNDQNCTLKSSLLDCTESLLGLEFLRVYRVWFFRKCCFCAIGINLHGFVTRIQWFNCQGIYRAINIASVMLQTAKRGV